VREVSVAGGEGGFAMGGEGGGEAVDVGKLVPGAKFGGGARQFESASTISRGSWAMSSMTFRATPGPLVRQVE